MVWRVLPFATSHACVGAVPTFQAQEQGQDVRTPVGFRAGGAAISVETIDERLLELKQPCPRPDRRTIGRLPGPVPSARALDGGAVEISSAEGVEIEFREVNMTVQRRISWLVIATTVACLALFSARAEAAQIFMCTEPPIKGDSRDKEFPDCIEVISAGAGIIVQVDLLGGGGGGTGKASFTDYKVVKRMDSSSPVFRIFAASGTFIDEVKISFRSEDEFFHVFFEVNLRDVVLTSVSMAFDASGGQTVPVEVIGFAFSTIIWTFTPLSADGKPEASITFGWNLIENRSL